jgi:hypothetical protein
VLHHERLADQLVIAQRALYGARRQVEPAAGGTGRHHFDGLCGIFRRVQRERGAEHRGSSQQSCQFHASSSF